MNFRTKILHLKYIMVIASMYLVSTRALACMCIPQTNVDLIVNTTYQHLFLGELISANSLDSFHVDELGTVITEVANFKVVEVYLGSVEEGDTVAIHQFGIGCTRSYLNEAKGNEADYILQAYASPYITSEYIKGELLTANLCSVSWPSDDDSFLELKSKLVRKYLNWTGRNLEIRVASIVIFCCITICGIFILYTNTLH